MVISIFGGIIYNNFLLEKERGYIYQNNQILFKLFIPSISLDRNVYKLNSKLNDVDYNIEILSDSNLEKNLYFIAGHSGDGDNCYFNIVRKIKIGEFIYLNNEDSNLVYKIIDKYFIEKNGYMEVERIEKNTLYLITCDIYNGNRQLIVKGILVNQL